MLHGRKILLGITGSIAAYKSAFLARLLVKAGAEVRVVMTPAATGFITPLTLSTLSKHPVVSTYTDDPETGVWNNHVELGMWGDVMLIAPASANSLSKMAHGQVDNVLMATYLSAKCPVMIAPAMDLDMYRHGTTHENLEKLQGFGHYIISPGTGELASGLHGEGRMAEPEEIVEALDRFFSQGPMSGKKVLITAGPTHEPIDPVRFIGNRSSGKMGIALAEAAALRGAEVVLVIGPTHLKTEQPGIKRVDVQTAADMLAACEVEFESCDVAIMSAAVADFRPANPADQKIKKEGGGAPDIVLEKTADIAGTLGARKSTNQLLVGFALETQKELENAKGKLERKNLDLIVLNSLNDPGAGFGHDTNKVILIDRENNLDRFELKSKQEVAADILDKIQTLIDA